MSQTDTGGVDSTGRPEGEPTTRRGVQSGYRHRSATRKADLIERLTNEGVYLTDEGWKRGDESLDVEERPSSGSGPSDKTALYAFKRAETTDDLLERLEDALADTDHVVREGETESGKETWSVVLPAEAQQETDGDEGTYTCAGAKANGEPCSREVEEDGGLCHQHQSQA